jgi:hypothetical protein
MLLYQYKITQLPPHAALSYGCALPCPVCLSIAAWHGMGRAVVAWAGVRCAVLVMACGVRRAGAARGGVWWRIKGGGGMGGGQMAAVRY